jgi:hypothetical protein
MVSAVKLHIFLISALYVQERSALHLSHFTPGKEPPPPERTAKEAKWGPTFGLNSNPISAKNESWLVQPSR